MFNFVLPDCYITIIDNNNPKNCITRQTWCAQNKISNPLVKKKGGGVKKSATPNPSPPHSGRMVLSEKGSKVRWGSVNIKKKGEEMGGRWWVCVAPTWCL